MSKKSLTGEQLIIALSGLLLLVIVTALLSSGPRDDEGPDLLTLGTGPLSSLSYPTGGMIAELVNRNQKAHGFRLVVESTGGALRNIDQVLAGEVDFAIARADLEYQAVRGEGPWQAAGPRGRLRALASLLPETVVLIATVASGIAKIEDLEGKRVDIGPLGSDRRKNAQELLRFAGIDWTSDLTVEELSMEQTIARLAAGELDAAFLTVTHPSDALVTITRQARVRFVALAGEDAIARHPYYLPLAVPSHLYPGADTDQPVATVATMATLITSVDMDEEHVYALTSTLFENLEEARSLHPAFAFLRREQMLRGFTAPIHPGALRYFRQTEEAAIVTRGSPDPESRSRRR